MRQAARSLSFAGGWWISESREWSVETHSKSGTPSTVRECNEDGTLRRPKGAVRMKAHRHAAVYSSYEQGR